MVSVEERNKIWKGKWVRSEDFWSGES